MDPATLALTAAGLVAKKALEAASGEAGKTGWQALGRITQTIRGWFAGDQEATETLDRLEAKPESRARAAELAEVLQPRPGGRRFAGALSGAERPAAPPARSSPPVAGRWCVGRRCPGPGCAGVSWSAQGSLPSA
jgi:hypothetical protein